eukprot:TRINITY_DN16149_c0_g1_i1.p1 TRINITY_DN16149_c0_g1~~TRINITY_DN16149_c0_g1_i1.p1  ORF type:complete len:471 (-),score=113.15 TRINITY_DN16149_c0_g1_i1:24-1436(-)
MQKLPRHNKSLVAILFLFLTRTVEHYSQVQMSSADLALIFAHLILRKKSEDSDEVDPTSSAVEVVKRILDNYDQIFPKKKTPTKGKEQVNNETDAPGKEKSDYLLTAVDELIAQVQTKLTELHESLQNAQTVAEAVQIARKIRTAKRILFFDDQKHLADSKKAEAKKLTGQQLNVHLRRSTLILQVATENSIVSCVAGFESVIGLRKTMEDTHVCLDKVSAVFPELKKSPPAEIAFYGVYDGHGGTEASALAEKHVHKEILTSDEFKKGNIQEACAQGLRRADKIILDASAAEEWKNGSTAVLAVILERHLYIANLGDSEAVLGKRKEGGFEGVCITVKHKPTEKAEKDRIKAQGGHVVFGRLFGDLAISRSLGDADYKKPLSDADFVSAEPYTSRVALSHTADDFLILACDGVWDKVSYQEAADLVGTSRDEGKKPAECAKALSDKALANGTKDNVTAIVVFFNWLNPS